ncbi:protein kinase domain-containing protein [Corallococcus macrosporus]|uniref:Protein kinase domain-containing protein n=1 Tax=Corallococcus macrosporus DSM 14697 TaxID=1189310 RepID=A0A250JZL0_9BACT|nr:protein kinase [Corallococcus macrosporus]ATB48546.1 hypothetical protein MYMAC_004173 [Corallococcus macrosporus DSM 14697]
MFNTNQTSHVNFRNIAAERSRSVIAWTGSGLSAPAKIPTWLGLRDALVAAAHEKTPSDKEAQQRQKHISETKQAAEHKNLWVAFQILKRILGKTTYRDTIRQKLMVAEKAAIPEAYKLIWKLRPAGILNLNLDGFASRAYGMEHPGRTLNQFSGNQSASHTHLLKSPEPFVANLHGTIIDESSWVFTQDEIRHLLRNEGYRHFISSCLSSKTIIFLGMSADDTAIAEHLRSLSQVGVDFGSHYWLTHRTDSSTDRIAEKIGIRLIRYENKSGTHEEVSQFFQDILKFSPQENTAPPVAIATPELSALPEPSALANLPADEIRVRLNAHISALLVEPTKTYDDVEQLLAKYDEAVYRAWYISTTPPKNKLIGYELKEQIGKGAFGKVFKAITPSGEEVAIKVLHEEIRKTPDMLNGFRRGVQSMRILSDHNVAGMVPYRQASEVPTMAVMDYVEGPDLAEAVKSGRVDNWDLVLRIASDIARIIVTAHALPERVLHRDLRPTNIMLKGFHTLPDSWEVVVLDFDLSWHRNALDVSIAKPASANGYLAPEQVRRGKGESTRSAAVDSFGIGMTIFFICGGEDPVFAENNHKNWSARIQAACNKIPESQWKSLPHRVARLIESSTKDAQSQRWDLPQIEGELIRLREAAQDPTSVHSAELLAEEIAAQNKSSMTYKWNPDTLSASILIPGGAETTITGNESLRRVEVTISWISSGQEDRKRLSKWLGDALTKAESIFFKAGWTTSNRNKDQMSVTLRASADINLIRKNFNQLSAAIWAAAKALTF